MMEESDRKRIRVNFTLIVRNVRPQDIVDFLYSEGVLEEDHLDMTTLTGLTQQEKMIRLVNALYKVKGSYPIFCQALIENEMEWLVNKLQETNIVEEGDSDDVDSPSGFGLHEKLAKQEKKLQEQSIVIDFLVKKSRDEQKKEGQGSGKVFELPELMKTMEDNGLSEKQVVEYIANLMKRKSSANDDTDSGGSSGGTSHGSKQQAPQTPTTTNFTQTVAITTAIDVIKYLATQDNPNIKSPKPNNYQKAMRRTVDEMISRHKNMFEKYVTEDSILRQTTGINFLLVVADEVFRDGQRNWGRIVALYAFGGWLAKHGIFEREERIWEMIGDVLGFYVAKNLGQWIEDNGGWDAFLEYFPENTSLDENQLWTSWFAYFSMVCGVAAIIWAVKTSISKRQ